MNDPFQKYQVSQEMRDMAEKSVDQARKAFDGLFTAAQKAAGTVEGSTAQAQTYAKDMASKAVDYAQGNINAAFDLAQNMVKANDFNEVMKLQGDFIKEQFANLQNQAKEFGSAIQQSMQKMKD